MVMNERLRKRKEELGITTEALSKLSGVPVGTINKILTGETKSPRCNTLAALEKVLFPEEGGTFRYGGSVSGKDSTFQIDADEYGDGFRYDLDASIRDGGVREEARTYRALEETEKASVQKRQGEYTLADYYALPEDVRAELIDGELFFMEAPGLEHQLLISELSYLFSSFIRQTKRKCLVLCAPLDVQLDCDDRTVVQPDILISCKKERRNRRGIYGAPDMVVEVTSPSTRKRDFAKKMQKYMDAGVCEYWIVDLQRHLVITYFFEEDLIPHVHTFQEHIPVDMYGGELIVDFSELEKRLWEI